MKAKKASKSGLVTMEDFGLEAKKQPLSSFFDKGASVLFSFSLIGNMVCFFRISDVDAADAPTSLVEAFPGR